jgi:hypothetical protein
LRILNSLRENSKICDKSNFFRSLLKIPAWTVSRIRPLLDNLSLAGRPPSMWLLIDLAEVSVVANIVVAPAPEMFAAGLPLGRQTINRTSLRTNGTRSVAFENDQSHEQERDDADTETDE